MKVLAYPSAEEVARQCAEWMSGVLERTTDPVVVVPAGKTPILLFAELVKRHLEGRVDLGRVHFFQLDEFVGVAPSDARSFQSFLRVHLTEAAGLPGARLHFLDGGAPEPALEIERHAQELEQLGGGTLAVVGIGRNGHVAFNEPGSLREARARVVALAETTMAGLRQNFAQTELPTEGMTLGIEELFQCAEVALLVTGASKQQVLHDLRTGPVSPELPASFFATHPAFQILADGEALGG